MLKRAGLRSGKVKKTKILLHKLKSVFEVLWNWRS